MGNLPRWQVLAAVAFLLAVSAAVLVAGRRRISPRPTPAASPAVFLFPSPSSLLPTVSPQAKDGCFIGGCSREICSDQKNIVSPCLYREEYSCLKQAVCERQANSRCGWTETAQYRACIRNLPKGGTGVEAY